MTTVLDVIQHYQSSIDKSSKDEKRLLHCIEKLYRLPVTVQHLQETGIGKTVNTLRKYEGEVGVAAKALVAKWKAMVAAEESSAAEDDDIKNDGAHDEDNSSPNEEKPQIKNETTNKPFLIHHEQEKQNNHNNSNSSSSNSSNKHKSSHSIRHDRSDKHRSDREHRSESHANSENSKDRSHHSRHGRDKDKSRDKTSEMKHKINSNIHASHKSSKVDDEVKIKQEHHSSSKSNSRDKDKLKSDSSRKRSSTSSPDNLTNENNLLKIKREKLSDDSDNEYHNLGENSKYKEKSMKSIHNSIKVKDEKLTTSSSTNSSHRTKSRDDHKAKCSSSSSSSGSTNNNNNSNHHHNSNHHSSNEEHTRSTSNSKHKVKDEPVSSHRVSSSSKHKEKIKNELDKDVKKSNKLIETDIFKPEKSLKREKDQNNEKHHSKTASTSSTSVPSSAKKLKNNHKEAEEEEDFDGIDCTMGASFADALAMIQKPTPYKSVNKKKTYNNSSPSSSSTPTISTPSTSKKVEIVKQIKPISTPSLLTSTAKLEPLDLEIEHVSDLPIITNNYKPMPLNSTIMDCVFSNNNNKPQRRQLTDEEAFGASISSKTVRTKVYSGIKTGALNQVSTLFDLCIKVLKKNIDALEYTGGVPFEILKPILEGATPQQLFTFEDYNPYLIDDSDMLWQHHCNRRFRGQKLQEFETWRDMFLRCQEEENLRFANLTENIKQSQKLSIPVKHTKLAYVDSLAKAPRNIQKKQNQFGTERKLVATPASRVASLSACSSNIAKTGDFRLRVAPGTRDTAQANNTMVRKKAPLMLKTLQFMKGHLKR